MIEFGGVKVGFTGAHGVGKTTALFGVAGELMERGVGVRVVNESAEDCVFEINEGTSVEAQVWILNQQINWELEAQGKDPGVVLCDRTSLDAVAYLRAVVGRVEAFEVWGKEWFRTYDYVVYFPPREEFLVENGVRSTDGGFQERVDGEMRGLLEEVGVEEVDEGVGGVVGEVLRDIGGGRVVFVVGEE